MLREQSKSKIDNQYSIEFMALKHILNAVVAFDPLIHSKYDKRVNSNSNRQSFLQYENNFCTSHITFYLCSPLQQSATKQRTLHKI